MKEQQYPCRFKDYFQYPTLPNMKVMSNQMNDIWYILKLRKIDNLIHLFLMLSMMGWNVDLLLVGLGYVRLMCLNCSGILFSLILGETHCYTRVVLASILFLKFIVIMFEYNLSLIFDSLYFSTFPTCWQKNTQQNIPQLFDKNCNET